MCTYSVISDYGRTRYPMDYWTPTTWPPFSDLLEQARRTDEATEQPDCEDPAKTEWIEKVEERLRRLENEPIATGQPDWEIG